VTPRATTAEITEQLTRVASVWEPFKRDLTALLHSGGSDTAAIRAVLGGNVMLMEQMNRAVTLMQQDAEQRVKLLLYVQAGLLAAGLSLVVAGVWVARTSISRPLRELAVAAHSMSTGDLSVELRSHGTREVRELSASFERMRASMLATIGARFGADAFDEAL
jgi:nitrate/nitrite-specific signal transduction histidine kinase